MKVDFIKSRFYKGFQENGPHPNVSNKFYEWTSYKYSNKISIFVIKIVFIMPTTDCLIKHSEYKRIFLYHPLHYYQTLLYSFIHFRENYYSLFSFIYNYFNSLLRNNYQHYVQIINGVCGLKVLIIVHVYLQFLFYGKLIKNFFLHFFCNSFMH